MGHQRIPIVIACLLCTCLAQQDQPNTYPVAGSIVNALTGAPVSRVMVQFSGRALLTGPEGEFSFPAAPAGRGQIGIAKPGFFPPGATQKGWSPTINFDVGPDSAKLLFKLYPEAVISGRVTGKDEEPLEGATIQLLHFVSDNGRKRLAAVPANARTDEDGNFRVAGLPAGRYYVAVKAGNVTRRILGAQTVKSNEAYPAIVYYPGTHDLQAATAFDLVPGQRVDAPFSLALGPAFKIAGTVVATGDWKQVNPPMIVDEMEQVLFNAEQFDPETGQFEFRAVPAGNYRVRLGGMDDHNLYVSSRRSLAVSRALTGVKLTLNHGAEIPVMVRTEFSKARSPGSCTSTLPDGNVQHSDCSDYPAVRVNLVSTDSSIQGFSTDFGPAKDRSLALRNVAPGRYVVTATPSFGGYVQAIRCGQLDLLRDELVVPENGAVSPIEVVLRDDSGTIRIRVQTQTSTQTATVLLLADGVLREPTIIGMASGNAELQTAGVAPGGYKVFAFDSIDGIDYRNPEALAKYSSHAASVSVTSNANATVTVDLIRTGE